MGVGVSDNRSFVASIAARYGPRLRRFLSVRLRNAADVPDLAQEVFLRLLRVEGYESIRSPEAYLFTIASHVIHQHAVRRSSEPVSVDITEVFQELSTPSSDDPPNQVAHAQRLDELERIFACLPSRVATALVLHRNNVLDKDPPIINTDIAPGGAANTYSAYDMFGRQLFLAFTAKF